MPLRSGALQPSMMSRIIVRLDTLSAADCSGRLYVPYLEKGAVFSSFMDMIAIMDRVFDVLAYPASPSPYRGVPGKKPKRGAPSADAWDDNVLTEEDGGNLFVVHVLFRQNADWQGKLRRAGEREETRFNSTLEMLRFFEEQYQPPPGAI